jgi:hypothetical protein
MSVVIIILVDNNVCLTLNEIGFSPPPLKLYLIVPSYFFFNTGISSKPIFLNIDHFHIHFTYIAEITVNINIA